MLATREVMATTAVFGVLPVQVLKVVLSTVVYLLAMLPHGSSERPPLLKQQPRSSFSPYPPSAVRNSIFCSHRTGGVPLTLALSFLKPCLGLNIAQTTT